MPRKKQQKPKRLTRLQRIQLRIENLVEQNAEKLGREIYLPDEHYILIAKSGPNQLLVTLLHKDIGETHPVLGKTRKRSSDISMELQAWEDLLKNQPSYTIDY